jgi:hypothetical protein
MTWLGALPDTIVQPEPPAAQWYATARSGPAAASPLVSTGRDAVRPSSEPILQETSCGMRC